MSGSGSNVPLRILFVEDNPDDVALMKRQLRADGVAFTSRCVQTREELLGALRSASWDIILLDFNLPKLNAPEVLRMLKEEQCDVPAILVSGTISEDFAVQLINAGAQDFILKPNLKRLSSAILSAVEKKTTERQRRAAEEELKRSHAELRALAAKLEDVREVQSSRIAREIHDDLGQRLTGIKFSVSRIAEELLAQDHPLGIELSHASQAITSAIESVRRIASELRPPILDRLGLVSTLQAQLREFQHQTGIVCSITSTLPDEKLPPVIATALFRMTQEAMTNVARHAHATEMKVHLQITEGNLELSICDNGIGIKAIPTGVFFLGIRGMKERLFHLGGNLEFTANPAGKGTMLRATIPIAALTRLNDQNHHR